MGSFPVWLQKKVGFKCPVPTKPPTKGCLTFCDTKAGPVTQWQKVTRVSLNKHTTYEGQAFVQRLRTKPSNLGKPKRTARCLARSRCRFKKAHVTHPELKMTFCLEMVSVKKNPQSALYTSLGVITKGAARAGILWAEQNEATPKRAPS